MISFSVSILWINGRVSRRSTGHWLSCVRRAFCVLFSAI